MNHFLYNISIVMVFTGILMLTYYLTKAYTPNKIVNPVEPEESEYNLAYQMRPSQTFQKMFNEPSIWQGYQTFDTTNLPLGAKSPS